MMKTQKKNQINLDVGKFIEEWNNKYPYDRWWRKKYNTPFGSESHKEANFVNMVIEYREDLYFQKQSQKLAEEMDAESDIDKTIDREFETTNNGKKIVKMTKKELDEEFDNLDLDQFNQ